MAIFVYIPAYRQAGVHKISGSMEYHGTKLTRNVRRTILATFFALFFVITPLIIMYTEGYRYDFKNGQRREIGAISIDTEPINATVNMDGVEIKSGMPIRLNNITPRKYHVRISAPNYFDWNKDIEIANKQTFYIKEISLIKKNSPELILPQTATSIELSSDKNYLAFINQSTVTLYNTKDNRTTTIHTAASADLKISWGPNHNWLVITNKNTPFTTAILINADAPDKKINLAQTTKQPITKLQWKETVDPELFYSTNQEIKSFKPITGNTYLVTKNIFLDWFMENGTLWTLQTTTNTIGFKIIKDTIGFASEYQIADAKNLLKNSHSLSIIQAIRDQILLKFNDQSLMLLCTHRAVFKIAGDKFTISPYNNWWLFWTPWELTTYSEGDEPILLNRSGEGLQQVLPMDKFNTLALVWNNKTTALFPYYLVTHDLISSSVTGATADNVNHILYFSGKIKDEEGIWKLSY
ncbi:MAG: PEGA domain-containing protein [Candidatus Magasanikbacteria bacterium]